MTGQSNGDRIGRAAGASAPLVIVTVDDLVLALLMRRREIGLSSTEVDHIAGLAGGYMAKIEATLTNPAAKGVRSLGKLSLPRVLSALGVGLQLVPMPSPATHEISPTAHSDLLENRREVFATRGRLGGRIRAVRLTDAERRQQARKAARARWRRRKAEDA